MSKKENLVSIALFIIWLAIVIKLYLVADKTDNWLGFSYSFVHTTLIFAVVSYIIKKETPDIT